MIGTLVEMLGNFYANNDLQNVEMLARSIHSAVPSDQVSLLFLGLAYYKSGRSSEALETFNKVNAGRKERATRLLKNEATRLPPAHSAALVCYEEATRHSPLLARLWCDLGTVLLELRRLELAIPAFYSSLKAQPNDCAYRGLGQAYRLRRNFSAARECFSRVRKLRERFAEPLKAGTLATA